MRRRTKIAILVVVAVGAAVSVTEVWRRRTTVDERTPRTADPETIWIVPTEKHGFQDMVWVDAEPYLTPGTGRIYDWILPNEFQSPGARVLVFLRRVPSPDTRYAVTLVGDPVGYAPTGNTSPGLPDFTDHRPDAAELEKLTHTEFREYRRIDDAELQRVLTAKHWR